MKIAYSDDIGIVIEIVDADGISFHDGKAYFNSQVISLDVIIEIYQS